MKILFVASEAVPFIKSGGLGDVIGSLPKALKSKCEDIRVVIPYYSQIGKNREDIVFKKYFFVNHGHRRSYVGVFEADVDGVTYYLIDNEEFFNRSNLYGEFDDGERFSYFSKAIIDLLPEIDYKPDIINANDWHTSLVPVYLDLYKKNGVQFYQEIKSVISIHNIEFQGKFSKDILGPIFGLDNSYLNILMFGDCLNLLKAAIQTSNLVTTVSETYADEILTPYFSYGLDEILRIEKHKIIGVLNGIDTKLFNPYKDSIIYQNYNTNSINKKVLNKVKLQEELNLEVDENIPMIGMIGRITHQKGMELLLEVFDKIMLNNLQLVIIGSGDKYFENRLREKQHIYRDKFRLNILFSNELAQKLYAASDMFLMPSKSEPCGLAQMIAMRYGSVPIVHSVGGLKDTVKAYNRDIKEGEGFTFQSFNSYDMLDAINRAIGLYNDKKEWKIIGKNGMKKDFSWKKSSEKYLEIYKKLFNY